MKQNRFESIEKMIENLQKIFPQQKIYLYGSYAYGLADDKSNVNIYIHFGERN